MASWLQNNLNTKFAPKHSLIEVLRQNMGGYRKPRDHSVVHASDLTKPDFCPRRLALMDLTSTVKKDEYISTALQATFDLGDAVSDLVREKWVGEASHGFWKCRRCSNQSAFGIKPDTPCKQGGRCNYKYEEASFFSEDFGVSGSIDLLANLGAPKLFVTEIKTITPIDFEGLAAPLAEHRIRTNLYMRLIEDDKGIFKQRINLNQAKVLYVSRAYGKKHEIYNEILPFKEFTVDRNDASLEPLIEKAREVKLFKEKGTLPKGICVTTLDKVAKLCQHCDACFSGHYPAGKVAEKVI